MTKIPILSAIPILGHTFKSNKKVNTKSELIIVIMPKLVRGDETESTPEDLD